MLLLLEIGMLAWGIIVLVNGRIALSPRRIVWGVPARVVGVLLLLPLPLAFAVPFAMAAFTAAQGKPIDEADLLATALLLRVSILLGCVAVALLIALMTAKPKSKKQPPAADLEEVSPVDEPPP